jgi:hypothetical protein
MAKDYFESIEQLEAQYKKRIANLSTTAGKNLGGRPKKKQEDKTPKQTCWACGKKIEYQLGLCSTCYQRLRSGKFLHPDMSAYDWDETYQRKDWRSVAAFYQRFFQAAESAGKTPQQLLTSAMEDATARAEMEIKQ